MSGHRIKWKNRFGMAALLLLLAVIAVACGGGDQEQPATGAEQQEPVEPLNWEVPPFSATDQEGKPVTFDDMKGKVWLAYFMFTRCPDVCPPMTANMTRVQQEFEKQGLDVEILSFSVDPEHDSPEVLKDFASNFDLDFGNWRFLSGYEQEEVNAFALEGFKGDVQRRSEGDDGPLLINHPVSFYVVNPEGKVHERYDGMDPDTEKMAADIRELQP